MVIAKIIAPGGTYALPPDQDEHFPEGEEIRVVRENGTSTTVQRVGGGRYYNILPGTYELIPDTVQPTDD